MKNKSAIGGGNFVAWRCFRLLIAARIISKITIGSAAIVALMVTMVSARAQTVTLTPRSGFKVFAGGGGYGGVYTNIQITASLSGDFSTVPNPVTLSVSGLPAGASYAFSTTSFTNSQNADFLRLAVTNVAKGTYPLTVSATTNGVSVGNSFVIPLIVGTLWTNSISDLNWSTADNWSAGVPGAGDDVMFQDASLNSNSNNVNGSMTVGSLSFIPNISGTSQYMTMDPGTTLSVVGTNGLAINEDSYPGNSKTLALYISGVGAKLLVTNTAANVAINGISSGGKATVLTMSGLDAFEADVNRFGVADVNFATQGAVGVQIARVDFARTNLINASYVGDYTRLDYIPYSISCFYNSDSYNNGSSQILNLGIANSFQADSIGFDQGRMGGSSSAMTFNSAFITNSPSVSFRNSDGISRVSLIGVAVDAGTNQTGSNTKFNLNLIHGHVDMLVDQMWIGRNRFTNNANANPFGKFEFDDGIVDVNTLRLGYQAYTNDSHCNGTITVGGNATNSALLKVNTELSLGYTRGDYAGGVEAAKGYGQIVINTNGTVEANAVTVGQLSGNNTITVNNGGALFVSNTLADATTALGTLTVQSGGALTLNRNGANTLVYVTNLVASGGVINIASSTGAGSFSPIISYAPGHGETASFTAGTMPAGLSGTIFNNTTTHTIDLTLSAGAPKTLLWQGYVNNVWDNSTKNWYDPATGLHTNFSTGDSVIFDDTASTASINVSEDVVPRQALGFDGIDMTNNVLNYTFSGAGGIRGAATFVKAGTQSVTINNYTEVAAQVVQGGITGNGTIGSVTVSPGATCSLLGGGTVLGSLTSGGIVNNAGTVQGALVLQGPAIMTNAVGGTVQGPLTTDAGSFIYNAGTFSGLGSATIATNATFINAGTIANGGNNAGSLTVSGTFEDMGVAAGASLNLTTLTISGGGTFIPGGDGIGTTTVLSDGQNTYNGRVILLTGSTNIFKVNVGGTPANTVLTSGFISFGPNQSALVQNGGTILLKQVGGPAYAVGQNYTLVQNNFGGAPFNVGLNTTNSLSVIDPSVPSAGLAWDFGQLISGGVLGIKAIPTTPTNVVFGASLTQTISTNIPPVTNNVIVTSLSWPAEYIGWKLEQQQTTLAKGLSTAATNWTTIDSSLFTNAMVFTNAVTSNSAVFYRMVAP